MIYCAVPRELADTLYPQLVEHYRDDDKVTVIVDRREFDRRGREGDRGSSSPHAQRRVIRDRRRPRVAGDMAAPAPPPPRPRSPASSATAAAPAWRATCCRWRAAPSPAGPARRRHRRAAP